MPKMYIHIIFAIHLTGKAVIASKKAAAPCGFYKNVSFKEKVKPYFFVT